MVTFAKSALVLAFGLLPGVLWLFFAVGFVVTSLWPPEWITLIWGAAGVVGYSSGLYLGQRVFRGQRTHPRLAAVGVLIGILAMSPLLLATQWGVDGGMNSGIDGGMERGMEKGMERGMDGWSMYFVLGPMCTGLYLIYLTLRGRVSGDADGDTAVSAR